MSAEAKSLAVVTPENRMTVTSEQVSLARHTVAKDLDNDQFALFCYNCQRLGVHPLDGLLVPIVRKDGEDRRLTFVNTVDLLRSRAADTGDYAGSDDPTFDYAMKDNATPSDAHVTVWKFVQGEKCSFSATARWEEYFPGEKQGFMWKNKPHIMLGKCAEALALRKAFPKQLAGLYIPEELQQEIDRSSTPSKTQQKSYPKSKPADVPVMCNECRATGGHLPHCSYRKKQEAQPEQKNQEGQENLQWVFMVEAVDERTDKKGKKYQMVTGVNHQNEKHTIYSWHTGETFDRLAMVKPGTKCLFVVKAQKSGEKTYYNIEKILEITGEQKPQGELIPPTEEAF